MNVSIKFDGYFYAIGDDTFCYSFDKMINQWVYHDPSRRIWPVWNEDKIQLLNNARRKVKLEKLLA